MQTRPSEEAGRRNDGWPRLRESQQPFADDSTKDDPHLMFLGIILQRDRTCINGDAIERRRRDTLRSVIRIQDREAITRAADSPLQSVSGPYRRDARVETHGRPVPAEAQQRLNSRLVHPSR